MTKFIIGLIIGVVAGGAGVFFYFSGVSHRAKPPGEHIRPPDASGPPPATAELVLRQDIFNDVLTTIFRDMNAPSFPIGQGSAGCENKITVLNQGSGVETRVSFENNKISAPLAVQGTYASMFGCTQFTGSAQANLELRFDADRQAVLGQITAENVELDGVNPFFSALLTPVVQSTLNERVNPIQILDGRQLAVNLPVQATGSTLTGKIADVRAEVRDNALHMFVTFQFAGGT